jgi:hypothetical protein
MNGMLWNSIPLLPIHSCALVTFGMPSLGKKFIQRKDLPFVIVYFYRKISKIPFKHV